MPAPSLGLTASFQGAPELKARLGAKLRNVRAVMERVPARLRRGPEGFSDQIGRREMIHLGARRRWTEPFFVHGALSAAARASEQVFWDAELGGAGGGQRITNNSALVTVSESVVGARLAALGNGIVSPAANFRDATGGFFQRQTPAALKAVKGIGPRKPRGGSRRASGAKATPGPFGRWHAMFWWVFYNYGVSLTDSQLRAGILTDPKNTGISNVTVAWFKDAVVEHVLGAGSLARGRANDPRNRRAT